jgi:outer membrane immunogenic protein
LEGCYLIRYYLFTNLLYHPLSSVVKFKLEAAKQMKKYIAFAFALSLADIAQAADIVPSEQPPAISAEDAAKLDAIVERWGGAYVGLNIGKTFASDTAPAKADGVSYGGFAGYNVQSGNFVAGIEASADRFDATFNDGSGIKSRFIYAGRLRGGLANDWIFAYASIGAEHAVIGNIAPRFTKDTALQLGVGVDIAVTKHIALGVDYTHAFYKKFAGLPLDVKTDRIQTRLSYSFN